VGAVAAPQTEALAPGDELGEALMRLASVANGRALVLDHGRLVGLLSMTDVSRLVELRRLVT
jgi:hypothetical protein